MQKRRYFVYILTNACATVFYMGMTNNLQRRTLQHKEGRYDGFTRRYKAHRLVYFEIFNEVQAAIRREKQLKRWRHTWKLDLIRARNPDFRDQFLNVP